MRYSCMRYFNAAAATRAREDHQPRSHDSLDSEVAAGQRGRTVSFGTDYDTS